MALTDNIVSYWKLDEAGVKLPDYFFITAPNYAQMIMEKEQEFLKNGGKFILENCEIVG